MGNEASHEYDGCTTLGYRVLGVQPSSPASRSGLVSFFDFLVGVNGQLLFDNGEHADGNGEYFEDLDFVAVLKDNVDKEIELLVWNIKSKSQRFINLVPSTNWGGAGLLGVTIRMDDYITAEENLLRILEVQPKSPAAMAGLTRNVDYLLGTTMESFENEEVLGDVLYEYEDQILEVYVYNTESDVVRVVTLLPNLKWGGDGLLGAQVGRGFLHRLPNSCRQSLGTSFDRKITVNSADDTVDFVVENVAVEGEATAEAVKLQAANAAPVESLENDILKGEESDLASLSPPAPASSEISNGVESLSLSDDLPPPPITVVDEDESNVDLR